ncbi:MAG: NUDIX domain-containing protein [Chloroflexi bacterium]|nr:NUDIX domain-containing protein [Chloroflexota bacterium]
MTDNRTGCSQPPPAHFLGGVGALVWDGATGRYLLLRRAMTKDFAAGMWECVTGRVDQGEGFEAAVRREVQEEVGLDVTLEYLLGTTHFYRGTAVPANELLGVVYLCTVRGDQAIRLSHEHDAYRWVTAVEATTLLSADDPSTTWASRLIERAEGIRPFLSDNLRQFNRDHGFELG